MGNTVPASERQHSSLTDDEEFSSPERCRCEHGSRRKSHHHHHGLFAGLGNHQHLPVVVDCQKKEKTKTVPTVFRWTGGGKSVALAGSFDNWKERIPMAKSHDDFATIVELAIGTHEYKYFVDGSWTYNPSEPKVNNEFGSCNNRVTVKESDFEVFQALAVDAADVGSPTDAESGEFTQNIPERLTVTPHHRPPALPPHLLQVILNKDDPELHEPSLLPEPDHVALNHLYALSIKDGVMTLSSTLRYKKKYVTTLLYRPV